MNLDSVINRAVARARSNSRHTLMPTDAKHSAYRNRKAAELNRNRSLIVKESAMTTPATLAPLTFEATKLGLRVVLLQGSETEGQGAIRGRIVTRKDGWLGVRFDDGVTRMARAKTLAKDTVQIVEQAPKPKDVDLMGALKTALDTKFGVPAPRVSQQPIGGKRATKVKAAGTKAPRTKAEAKVGQPCLCACGVDAKPGRSFLPGHDARFHGWMKRLADQRIKPSEVPAAALKLMNIDKDNIPTTDYDGTPWKP